MSDFLLIAPTGWEQASPEMLQRVIEGTGNIEGVASLISNGQFGELGNLLDEIRFNTDIITNAMLVQETLWFIVG